MKIKYLMLGGLLTLSSVLTIASADDPFTSYNNDLGIYDPSSFSLSDTFENYSIEVLDFSCSLSDPCLLSIQDDNGFNCDIIAMGDSITYNNCSTQTLSSDGSNVLTFYLLGEGYAGYDYINLRLVDGTSSGAGGSDSGESSESDNALFGSISSTITSFSTSLIDRLNLILWCGVAFMALLFFWRIVYDRATGIFNPNKKYKKWKDDFVKNHDVNNIINSDKLSIEDKIRLEESQNEDLMIQELGYNSDDQLDDLYYGRGGAFDPGYYDTNYGIRYYTDLKVYKKQYDDFVSKYYDENNMDAFAMQELEWKRFNVWKGGYKKNI